MRIPFSSGSENDADAAAADKTPLERFCLSPGIFARIRRCGPFRAARLIFHRGKNGPRLILLPSFYRVLPVRLLRFLPPRFSFFLVEPGARSMRYLVFYRVFVFVSFFSFYFRRESRSQERRRISRTGKRRRRRRIGCQIVGVETKTNKKAHTHTRK